MDDQDDAVQTWTARPATQAAYAFGEGLRYDAASGCLLWVDLLAGRLHRAPVEALDDVETLADLDLPLGAFAPCVAGGWLLATGRGLSHLADDGTVRSLVTLEPEQNRMNDAGCDLQGRLWAGSMAYEQTPGAGSLYRVELDGTVVRVRDDVTIGNGPAFSPDGRTLYLDDSGRSVTLAYDLEPESGRLAGERELVRYEQGVGDGLTVDDEGHLWVAVYDGSGVLRFAPDGRLVGRVEIATPKVTSCCLVDGRLYATTVREGLESPTADAGRLFVADVGVSGPPVRPYRGTTLDLRLAR